MGEIWLPLMGWGAGEAGHITGLACHPWSYHSPKTWSKLAPPFPLWGLKMSLYLHGVRGFGPSASGFEVHWTLICANSKKAKIGSSGLCISAPSVNAEGFITAQQAGSMIFRSDVLSAAKTCELCKGSLSVWR